MSDAESNTQFSINGEYTQPHTERLRRSRRIGGLSLLRTDYLPEVMTAYDEERAFLHSQIIGQDAAIDAIIEALDKNDVRRPDDHRPIASLSFLGPTGVGKTETAIALSRALAPKDPYLLQIDCAGYSNGHEITALLGSPPSYVGHEQEPLLSKANVERDGVVILFDEIEKGSDELANILLKIMDKGVLRLNNGEVVSFRAAVVILTSNLGANEMAKEADGRKAGFSATHSVATTETIERVALNALRDFFRPELLNRLDSTVVFHPLDEASLHAILDVKLSSYNELYRDEFGAYISLSDKTREYLVGAALNERHYGVRPLVRALEKQVLASFGRYSANEKVPEGSELLVYHRDELDPITAQEYQRDLVFAVRKDPSVQKRPPIITTQTQQGIL
jgi:ATP-dependent Clp protease ATP-binding subunit ClpA